jgi:hypothetical protein
MTARHHTTCSAEGCRAQITRGWFCKDHWFAVPPALRSAVLDAWKAARASHCRAPRDEQDRLNRAYGAAFRACQDHLRTAPRTPAVSMSTVAYAQDGQAVTYVEGRML